MWCRVFHVAADDLWLSHYSWLLAAWHVLVSPSLCWMDGCQHDPATQSLFFSVWMYNVWLTPSLIPFHCGFHFICCQSSLCVHCPPVCLSPRFFFVSLSVFPFSSHLLRPFCVLPICSRLSAGATCGRWRERKSRKRHTDKSSSGLVDPQKTAITYMTEWCSLSSEHVASVVMKAAARLCVGFCVDSCLFSAYAAAPLAIIASLSGLACQTNHERITLFNFATSV